LRRNILLSTDHRVIGLQYAVTCLCFLLIGFTLVVIIRWQLAYPGVPVPIIGEVPPELYNQLGAMHGTIMIFLGVVPL
jgi:cytochrome c oxidase subunit I